MEIRTPQTMKVPICVMAFTNVTISVQNNRALESHAVCLLS